MNDLLPNEWTSKPLSELVDFALGGDWGKDVKELGEGMVRVRVIRGTEFRNWSSERASSAAERCIRTTSLEKRCLHVGDIILEVSGGGPQQPVGRTVLIDQNALDGSVNYFV